MSLSFVQPSDDDLLRRLRHDNPWWDGRPLSPVGPPRPAFARFWQAVTGGAAGRPVILTGPCGVGKTAMVHQAVARLLDEGVAGAQIVLVRGDRPLLSGMAPARLPAVLEGRHRLPAAGPVFVIFDAVARHPDWEAQIASLAAARPRWRVVAVSALAPRAGGGGKPILLAPLSFAEYLGRQGLSARAMLPQSNGDGAGLADLNRHFLEYLQRGAFPGPGGEAAALAAVLHADLPARYGIANSDELTRLLVTLAYHAGAEFGIEQLSGALAIAKNTLRRYLDYLENAWLVRRLARIDQNATPFKRAVTFKVHLTHPALRAGITGAAPLEDEALSRLAETALYAQFLASAGVDNLFYARWGRHEVPFVYLDRKTGLPLFAYHCLWRETALSRRRDLSGLIAFAERHTLPLGAWVLTRAEWRATLPGSGRLRAEPVSALALRIGLEAAQQA